MKVSFLSASVGLAVVGAVALLGTAAPARAEGGTASSFSVVEGLVVKAADPTATAPGSLVIHPVFGGDVMVGVDPTTHFRKAGGPQLDTPDEQNDSALVPAVRTPEPSWFVGLFARAYYNKATLIGLDVALSRPEPVFLGGVVVGTPTVTELDLNVPNRGALHLTLNTDTICRMNGLPVGDATGFQAGDLAEVLFWHTGTEDEAIRVNGRLAPLQHFEGALIGLLNVGGAVNGFSVSHGGGTPMSFTVDANTSFKVDGKAGAVTDLKAGQMVSVSYRSQGGANLAVGVLATTPKPPPTPKPSNTGAGDKGKGSTSTGGTNTGDTGKGKPAVTRPQVVEGIVSVLCDGSVFKIKKGATEITFSVDTKTRFQANDKPVVDCTALAVGQDVHVIFLPQADGTKLAMYVLIHVPPANKGASGGGGGAGTPTGSNTEPTTGGDTAK